MNGTFISKLSEVGSDPSTDDDISFYAFECTKIRDHIDEAKKNMTLRYVEHEMHNRCFCFASKLGKRYSIISDTKRTAPRKRPVKWASGYTDELFEKFITRISASGKQ